MLIAQKLRKDNIAEYLLYMWQIEDIIRANNLDIESIEKTVIQKYDQPENIKKEILEWFESLIDMMKREEVVSTGHLIINKNIIILLTDLHNQLLKSTKHPDYQSTYYKTLPYIVELRSKGNKNNSEIETCFDALYAYLLMKLKQQTVTKETTQALSQISNFLRILSTKFKLDQENNLEL